MFHKLRGNRNSRLLSCKELVDVSALKQEVIYIEKEQIKEEAKEHILLDPKHWIWPFYFWAIVLVIIILLGMGVVRG